MRFPVRICPRWLAAAVVVCAAVGVQAQNTSQNSSQNTSSSSSSSSTQPNSVQTTSTQPAAAPYISVDPLANVRYDNKWDLSLGAGYDHMKAGPNLLQGANLGGLDFNASMWLTKHWAVEATDRTYVGTSGTAPNTLNLKGPLIMEYLFAAGPEWLGPHNKHGALIAHAMAGGIYGNFEHDLLNQPPSRFGFYNNQFAPVFVIGGHMDLNRSEHWVFRITPDAVWTRYGINYDTKITQNDINFAISVGLQYKFTGTKRSHKKENWVSGW